MKSGDAPPVAEEDGPAEAHREQAEGTKAGDAADGAPEPPAVQAACPANFGNSDIFGGGWADPTP